MHARDAAADDLSQLIKLVPAFVYNSLHTRCNVSLIYSVVVRCVINRSHSKF